MGTIDLDPATNKFAQGIVNASRFYTKQNSLRKKVEWTGKVWLNPPYGRVLAKPFVDKLVKYFLDGNVSEAIILTNNVPDVTWYSQSIGKYCSAICQLDHRISFIDPKSGVKAKGNDRNQLITYLGSSPQAFVNAFSRYGRCFIPVEAQQ